MRFDPNSVDIRYSGVRCGLVWFRIALYVMVWNGIAWHTVVLLDSVFHAIISAAELELSNDF